MTQCRFCEETIFLVVNPHGEKIPFNPLPDSLGIIEEVCSGEDVGDAIKLQASFLCHYNTCSKFKPFSPKKQDKEDNNDS